MDASGNATLSREDLHVPGIIPGLRQKVLPFQKTIHSISTRVSNAKETEDNQPQTSMR